MRTSLCLSVVVVLAVLTRGAEAEVRVEKVSYAGWENCYSLSNGTIELVTTSDVGPRIIHFGFEGEENEFGVLDQDRGKTGGDPWRMYGGHRLWHAPEDPVRTYWPDNGPVDVQVHSDGLTLLQPVEDGPGIQKQITVRMHPTAAEVRVEHRLFNRNLWPVELAPWVLSVMNQGGMAIVPQPTQPVDTAALLPNRAIILWPYTRMTDPRFGWGDRYVTVRQDPENTQKTKVGVTTYAGWAAYYRKGHLFVKRFPVDPNARYPDFGSTVEIFTNSEILEVETLGPLREVEPGAYAEHLETWTLRKDVDLGEKEEQMHRTLQTLLAPQMK